MISLILKANRVHNFRMKLSKSATVQMYEDKKSSTTEQYRESAQAVCMCMRGAHSKVFQIFFFASLTGEFLASLAKQELAKMQSLYFSYQAPRKKGLGFSPHWAVMTNVKQALFLVHLHKPGFWRPSWKKQDTTVGPVSSGQHKINRQQHNST